MVATARRQTDPEEFYQIYTAAMDSGSAAVFAGAGLSRSAGFLDWRGLMQPFAERLGLDVDMQTDLAAVAQYFQNSYGRGRLAQAVQNLFRPVARPTPSHELLASLPIDLYWTTNYDNLLEEALRHPASGGPKTVDVLSGPDSLRLDRPETDATIYKLHGDAQTANDIVITLDDFDRISRSIFFPVLLSHLVTRTFLFLGFSFTDPNLANLLRTLRYHFQATLLRQHYVLLKREAASDYPGKGATTFRHQLARQQHFTDDIQRRFGINTVLIDSYSDVLTILKQLQRRYHLRNVMVSGSSSQVDDRDRHILLCQMLGERLIRDGYNLVIAFGTAGNPPVAQGNVNGPVIAGAVKQFVAGGDTNLVPFEKRLRLKLFPAVPAGVSQNDFWRPSREELIGGSSYVVFVRGNELTAAGPADSRGVLDEYAIARAQEKCLIPIGATGGAASTIWKEVDSEFERWFPGAPRKVRSAYQRLGNERLNPEQLINAVSELLAFLTRR